jgi:hypothetical protein
MARVRAAGAAKKSERLTWKDVCELGLELPGMELSTSYGTPALKAGGKLVIRLREDGETMALVLGFPERDELMGTDPETFFITDHYANYPAVVVRLATVQRNVMKRLLQETWQVVAPARVKKGSRS